jgi:hypothetical protein
MSVVFDSNQFIPTQRENLKKEIDEILDDFMEPLVNATIIEEIRVIADAANVPKSFAEHVKFIKTGPNIGKIINTWGTEDNPLARYFNYGTSTHWIEPLTADGVLAWEATEGRNPSAIYFQGQSEEGDVLFSKGHYVAGVPRTEVMERGFNIGKKRLVVEAGKLVQKELRYRSE